MDKTVESQNSALVNLLREVAPWLRQVNIDGDGFRDMMNRVNRAIGTDDPCPACDDTGFVDTDTLRGSKRESCSFCREGDQ